MSLKDLKKNDLKDRIITLMDVVEQHLEKNPDIDRFLDETDIFDDFEKVLPDEEYPIFVITILNGFKSDDLLNKLVNDIYENK